MWESVAFSTQHIGRSYHTLCSKLYCFWFIVAGVFFSFARFIYRYHFCLLFAFLKSSVSFWGFCVVYLYVSWLTHWFVCQMLTISIYFKIPKLSFPENVDITPKSLMYQHLRRTFTNYGIFISTRHLSSNWPICEKIIYACKWTDETIGKLFYWLCAVTKVKSTNSLLAQCHDFADYSMQSIVILISCLS